MSDFNPYEKVVHDPNQYVVQTHFERADHGQGSMFRVQPWRRGYGPSRSRSVEASMDRVTDFTYPKHSGNVVEEHRTTGGAHNAPGPGRTGYEMSQQDFRALNQRNPMGATGNTGPGPVDRQRPAEYGYRTKQEGWNIDTSQIKTLVGRGSYTADSQKQHQGQARANTLDTIKRSSIPTEHLQGLTIQPGGKLAPRSSGTYWRNDERITTPASRTGKHYTDASGIGRVTREPGAPESTLAHEIGHHVEYQQNATQEDAVMANRDRRFMSSPEGTRQLTDAYARPNGPVEWQMGALKEDDGSTMMDEHGYPMYPKGKQRDAIAHGIAAEKVPQLIEATKNEIEYPVGRAVIPGGVDTGTREGFADAYATHHGERDPSEAYSKAGIETNVKSHRDRVGEYGGPRFGLTMQREKKLGISAYEHERHRWGQEAAWEHPVSEAQFGQIPGQQKMDLR